MTKKIAIVGWKTGENSFGVTVPYLRFFQNYGDVIILGVNDDTVKDVDLLVLPGGGDVSPNRYNAKPDLFTGIANTWLEYFDKVILPKYIENKTPIFGICRGLQTLNVHFGGTLIQHLDNHATSDSDKRWEEVHSVGHFIAGSDNEWRTFASSLDQAVFMVNSLHHQAIETLGKGLQPVLREIIKVKNEKIPRLTNVIEGIKHESLPIYAVQYHPEEIYDEYSDTVIKSLLKKQQ